MDAQTIRNIVEAAQQRLDALPAEKAALEELIRTHSSVLSAVRRVPLEILCHIFRLTLPDGCTSPDGSSRVLEAPWRLELVCKRWMDAAVGDKHLWSSIRIFSRGGTNKRYPSLPTLENQLRRSGNLPLEVKLDWLHSSDNELSELLPLLEAVVRQSNRWARFKFIWNNGHPDIFRAISQIRGRLSLLRCLEIGSDRGELPTEFRDIFADAPQLRQVKLTNHEHEATYSSIPISAPWQQITQFRASFDPQLSLQILRLTSNLVDCGMGVYDDGDGVSPTTPIVVLPHLRRLSVIGCGNLNLPWLQAPNLEYLFHNSYGDDTVLPFLLRSGCRLIGLSVEDFVSPNLIQLLPHIPTLSYFQASLFDPSRGHPPERFFRAMTVTGASTDLCPRLTRISIELNYLPVDDSLLKMIESRWHVDGVRSLEYVRIFAKTFPRSVLDGFNALRDEGLEIVLLNNISDPNWGSFSFGPDMESP
jgi:hypothetical protein